jgi:predicted nucleotide-binding protein
MVIRRQADSSMSIAKSRAIQLINQKIEALEAIKVAATYETRFDQTYQRVYYGAEHLITELFSDDEAKQFRRNVTGIAFAGGVEDPRRELEDYRDHLARCIAQLNVYKERIENFWPDDVTVAGNGPEDSAPIPSVTGKDIFIVYGHDESAKYSVAYYLTSRLGLKPVMFDDNPDESMTIIEKLEDLSKTVGYAIILLTPDDVGALQGADTPGNPRARQNVVLELGYFLGRLGRKRVCILRKGAVEIPSDLHGVLYKDMDPSGGWQAKLRQELEKANIL